MKFSKQLLKNFISLEYIKTSDIYKKLNTIGLEVDSLEHMQAPKGVVVGKILDVYPHPNADKLQVCRVDIGNDQTLNIVCGAKNVAPHQMVPIAMEGTKINDKLTITKSELRGVMSEGMICSSTELGFPKINDGILVLDFSIGALETGKPLADYPLFNDDVFEISITPNRGDCLSLLGIARDLSVAFDLILKDYRGENVQDENSIGIGRLLQIHAERHTQSSLLYSMIECNDFTLPLELAFALAYNDLLQNHSILSLMRYATLATGTIFNVYPNNLCHSTEEPHSQIALHIKANNDGVESVFAQDKLLSQIGIKQDFEPLPQSCKGTWIIEASYIPPEHLLKPAIKHYPKDSELYYRTSRGSNPNLTESNQFLCTLFRTLSLKVYSGSHELLQSSPQKTIRVDTQKINKLIGNTIETNQMVIILKKLGFEIDITPDENFLALKVPAFRHDIHDKQDVAEEIIRMIGIDTLQSMPLSFYEQRGIDSHYKKFLFERDLAKKAIGVGFSESVHFVFAQKDRLKKLGFKTIPDDLDIKNPITEEFNTLRPTLLPALLDSMAYNLKNSKRRVALFEIGSVFDMCRNETQSIAFVASKVSREAIYPNPKDEEMNFFDFADKISQIIGDFSLKQSDKKNNLYHPTQSADIIKNHQNIGTLARLHPALQQEFELDTAFIAEIDVQMLFNDQIKMFQPFSKMQKNQKDLTVLIDRNILFSAIRQEITNLHIHALKEIYPLDIYHDDSMPKEEISLTLRCVLQSDSKSLDEKEMYEIMQQILAKLQSSFGAKLK